MTAYATRSPLALLTTNTHYMMAEHASGNRRKSARLNVKDDIFAPNVAEKTKQNGLTKGMKVVAKGSAVAGPKRKLDYDEEDDGFKFTRAKSKRAKPTPTVSNENAISLEPIPQENPVARRKSRRISEEPQPMDDEEMQSPRRSTRQQTNDTNREIEQTDAPNEKQPTYSSPRSKKQRDTRRHESLEVSAVAEQAAANEGTKIALPFADTPVIRRNREMRKGNTESRRSSLSMRGRRASSLIDSGTSSALPHDQVETKDFYKHIESSLLEPRRMRQLLMWCGARALGEQPSFGTEDRDIKLAARKIQQELLNDFSTKAELSDWFSREDSPAQARSLKPNPKNLANAAKISELEAKLSSLRAERESWTNLQKPPSRESISINPLPQLEALSLTSIPKSISNHYNSIQPLLTTSHALPSSSSASEQLYTSITRRLDTATTAVSMNLDKLLDSVNTLGQHVSAAEGLGKRVLRNVADLLEEKDRRVVEREGSVGARDTLRALARVIDRG